MTKKMKTKKVSVILFYKKGIILLQDRRNISKHGEEYGFFGGHIEPNETPEQALLREIKEELNFEIKNYKFFKNYKQTIPELGLKVERWVYLSSMPDIKKLKVSEGKPKLIKFKDSFNLKMVPGDVELLKEIYSVENKI